MNDPAWLKEIDAREKAATKGPWTIVRHPDGLDEIQIHAPVAVAEGDDGEGLHAVCMLYGGDFHPTWGPKHDGPFIAHSRADVPLMHGMLRLLANALVKAANTMPRHRRIPEQRYQEVVKVLAAYESGVLPTKGEPDGEGTQTG